MKALSKMTGREISVDTLRVAVMDGLISDQIIKVNGVKFSVPKGIYFKCVGCGNCCRNQNRIHLLKSDIRKYGHALDYEKVDGIQSIKRTSCRNCIYLKDNKCEKYEVRPIICRMFPFTLNPVLSKKERVYSFFVGVDGDYFCQGFHVGDAKNSDFKKMARLIKKTGDEVIEEQIKIGGRNGT